MPAPSKMESNYSKILLCRAAGEPIPQHHPTRNNSDPIKYIV